MKNYHPAALPIDHLLKDCEIKKTRRGGPGGQHRNKVESAIVITHVPTQIIGQAGERRSQHENRSVAIERLRLNLAVGIRNQVSDEQTPSKLWRSRTKSKRISASLKHADFPALLAEAMDFIQATGFEIPLAAKRLHVSNSQLFKLIKSLPPAFSWLNENRIRLEMSPLK